jgi:DNA repair ATPase RecN
MTTTESPVDRLQDPSYLKAKAEREAEDAREELIDRWKEHRRLIEAVLDAQHLLVRTQDFLVQAVDRIESIQIKRGGFSTSNFNDAQEAQRSLASLQQSVLDYAASLDITSPEVPRDKRVARGDDND